MGAFNQFVIAGVQNQDQSIAIEHLLVGGEFIECLKVVYFNHGYCAHWLKLHKAYDELIECVGLFEFGVQRK